MINWLTPIVSAPAPGQFASEIKQKQSECDSYRNTNSVCDSVSDSLLPTSSAHTIIHFSNGPGGEDLRGDSPALLKQWVGPGSVRRRGGGLYGLDPLITQQQTLTFRNTEPVAWNIILHLWFCQCVCKLRYLTCCRCFPVLPALANISQTHRMLKYCDVECKSQA